ncbi:MAG: helix-turn-helix domain-containing protein [Candidatus Andersenbacteria bacterium]
MIFETELKKLGLKDKEAAVYLSCLQLGPSPVQPIARKAKVVRATTYVVLESLMNRGLVTQYKEGKKTLFSAEPPRQLMRLLEKEQESIQGKRLELEHILPELQVLMKAAGGRPTVRYFSGLEGLHAMRQEIIMYSKPGDTIYNFTPVEHLDAIFPQIDDPFTRQRMAKGIRSKTLFTTRSRKLRELLLAQAQLDVSERKYIPLAYFPGTSGMTIFGDRIAIGTFVGKLMGVIIESQPMTEMMKKLFELAWIGASNIDET